MQTLQKICSSVCAGEVWEALQNEFAKCVLHVNTKRIQSVAFQADKESPTTRVVQFDFAMSYSCELQDEVRKACERNNRPLRA